jgi:hypothetical protein
VGLGRVQLDDYDDYLLDPLNEDVDGTMDSESPANIKVEDADDIQKECHRLINAKRTQRRHRAVDTIQQGSGNLHNSSTGDLQPSSTLLGMPATSSLPGSKSVKKWKPIAPPTINSLTATWKQLGSVS